MLKKISIVSMILALTSCVVFADLKSAEKNLSNTTQTNSSSSGASNDGHYSNQTQVVGSRSELYQKRFSVDDFDAWLDLYALSRALETYHIWIAKKYISPQGVVLVDNPFIDNIADDHQWVRFDRLAQYYRSEFRPEQIYKLLLDNKVLDGKGYIVGIDKFDNEFNVRDFNAIEEKILSFKLGFNDMRVGQLVAGDLYRLLVNESHLIVVNTLETTTYQSKQSYLIDNLIDNAIGTGAGKVVNPDKLSSSRGVSAWVPQFNPYSHFRVYYGFSEFLYQNGNKGLVSVYGADANNTAVFVYSEGNGIVYNGFDINSHHRIPGNNLPQVPYYNLAFQLDEFRDGSGRLAFYNFNLGRGIAFPVNVMDLDFGLVLRQGIDLNGVGFSCGLTGQLYPIKPIYVHYSGKAYVQPSLKDSGRNWEYLQLRLGLGVAIKNGTIETGVQVNSISNSWYGAASLFF